MRRVLPTGISVTHFLDYNCRIESRNLQPRFSTIHIGNFTIVLSNLLANSKRIFLSIFFILTIFFVRANTIQSTTSGGNWNATATWTGGVVPGANDSAVINGSVTVNVNTTVGSVTIVSGKTLTVANSVTLVVALSPAGTGGTMGGWFTNNGTLTNGGTNSIVSMGTNGFITGSTLTAFNDLTINTTNTTDVVTLVTSGISINYANGGGGTLSLTKGIFKIGTGHVLFFNGNGAIITNPNSTAGMSNLATTGTNGSDGGKIIFANTSGGSMNINGSALITFYDLIVGAYTVGNNTTVNQNNTNILIDDTLRWPGNNPSWNTNSPKYSSTSTLYINYNGQGFSPGSTSKMWNATSGYSIGVTAGYPNNVTLVNVGSSSVTTATGCHGVFAIGDGTTTGTFTINNSSFFTGGIVINNGSSLTASTNFTDSASWLRQGSTIGTFTPGTNTVKFAGTGTIGLSTGTESSFYNIALIGGASITLNNPVTLPTAGALILTSGIITTTASNILSVTNTATSSISGTGSSANMINGPVKWSILNSGTNVYTFPVGSGTTYLPLALSSTNTTSGNVVTVTAFATSSGGSAGTGLSAISTSEYWSLTTSSGLGTTGSTVTLTRPSAVSPNNAVGESSTAGGSYSSLGSSSTTTNSVTSGNIGTSSPGFLVLGQLILPTITLADNSNGQVGPANISLSSSNNIIYNFQTAVTTSAATINQIVFSTSVSSTYTTSDITDFKIYYSTTNNFVTPAPTLLGTISTSLGIGSHTLGSLSTSIASGATGYFWITADIPSGATSGHTIIVSAITPSNLTFAAGTPTDPTPPTTGGTQTIIALPAAVTSTATLITTTSSTLNGTVNANGVSSTTFFNYGTSTSPYSNTNVTASPSPVTGSSATSVSLAVSGLIPNTLYNFQAGGTNANGTNTGSNLTLTTLPNAPTIGAPSSPTASGFTANWTAPTGQGSVTYTYTVQASTSNGFGVIAASGSSIASGTLSYTFTTLSSATTYYYRVYAVNTQGSSVASGTSAAITTLVVAGTACTTGSGSSASPAVIVDAASAPSGPSDPQWANAPSNSIAMVPVPGSGAAITGSTWKGMFDGTNLYVLENINDHTPESDCGQGGNAYQWDGVEVYVDGANGKQGIMTTSGKQASQWAFNYGCTGTANITGTNEQTAGVTYAISTNPGGASGSYTAVITIPWSSVYNMQNFSGSTISALSTIGFDCGNNDNQNGSSRNDQETWFFNNGNDYQIPSQWGTATLSVCAPPTVSTPVATSITSTNASLGATITALNGGGSLVLGGSGTEYSTSSGLSSPTITPYSGTPTVNTAYATSVTGLNPQTQYYYAGYATRTNFNTNVSGVSSTSSFRTLSTVPAAQPTFGTTTGITCTQATLNWSAVSLPSGATAVGYILLRRTDGTNPTVAGIVNATTPGSLSLPSGTTLLYNGSAVTYTNISLTAGITYTYLVIPYTWDNTNTTTIDYNVTGTLATTSVLNPLPGAAGSITGTSTVCAGSSGISYSVGTISNASSYTWSYSGTGFTPSGNTASISGSFSATATSGNLTVTGVNSCGNGTTSATYAITVNPLPGAAGSITGSSTVCAGSSGTSYSVGTITNASSYIWSYSGTGFTPSGNTASITGSFSGSATSGNLTVTGMNSCGNGSSSTIFPVTINQPPTTSNAGNDQTICNTVGSSATLSANTPISGSGVWTVTSGPNTSASQFSNITDPDATFTPSGGVGTYVLTWTISNSSCTASSSDVSIIVSNTNSWSGPTNGDWNTAANWSCGIVPASTADVVIPANSSPVLSTDVTVNGLSVGSTSTVSINGNTLTVNGSITGTGTLIGTSASNLTIGGTAGTLNFTSGFASLGSLTVTSGSATLGTGLAIYNNLDVAGGTLNLNSQNVSLKSGSGGTASVNTITGTLSGATNVTVERYIPSDATRAWRLLSVPTSGSQTINAAWQEGQTHETDNTPGYGTIITANASNTNWAADGYDTVQVDASIITYSPGSNSWSLVPSTYNSIATTSGYFLYIRGDRSELPSGTSGPTNATTLRTTGGLYQGAITSSTIAAGQFGLLGNPYVSSIDFTRLTLNGGVNSTFYLWDPKIQSGNSLGVYQTFNSATGYATPISGGSYGSSNTRIESGAAFFVYAPSASGSVGFSESSKTGDTTTNQFRPAGVLSTNSVLQTNLFSTVSGAQVDGNFAVFNSAYSNGLNGSDALKLANNGENLAILLDSTKLAVEARQPVTGTDTIFYDMWNMQQQQYKLQFIPTNLNTGGLTAYLQDAYLGTSTPLNLSATSTVAFSVDGNAASSASNRFRVVFNNNSSPVPVTFIAITAQQKSSSSINVSWEVGVESGVAYYEVEHSTDGKNFTAIGQLTPKSNAVGTAAYNWLDDKAVQGVNYYRVMSVGVAGDIKYTEVVKVVIGAAAPAIAIYPNPVVKGGYVSIELSDQPAGVYGVRVLNTAGQEMYATTINHGGGSSVHGLVIPAVLAGGLYKLEVTSPGAAKYTLNMVIQ